MGRETYVTGADIKDDEIKPSHFKTDQNPGWGSFVIVDERDSQKLKFAPIYLSTSSIHVGRLNDTYGIPTRNPFLLGLSGIIGGIPDIFLFAHKQYSVRYLENGTETTVPGYIFNGRGDAAKYYSSDAISSINSITIEVVYEPNNSSESSYFTHSGYLFFVFHGWRYDWNDSSGGFSAWSVDALTWDEGNNSWVWQENVISRSGVEDKYPIFFTLGGVGKIKGVRVNITGFIEANWGGFYIVEFSAYRTSGKTAAEGVGALPIGGGTLFGDLSLHEDAVLNINGTANIESLNVGNILPKSNGNYDLGSGSLKFKDGYFTGTIYATSFQGDLAGNADSSTKWKNGIELSLTGDVVGQGIIDGSADVQINTTLNASLEDLSDVSATEKNSGEVLMWDGTQWTNDVVRLIQDSDASTVVDVSSSETITMKANNTEVVSITSGNFISNVQMRAPKLLASSDGSATAPAFSFASDTGAGFYRIAANRVAFCPGSGMITREDEIVSSANDIRRNRYYGVGNDNSTPHIVHANDLDTGILFLPNNYSVRLVAGAQTGINISNNGVYIRAAETPDSEMENSTINFYISADGSTLVVKVRKSDGSIVTGEITLQ